MSLARTMLFGKEYKIPLRYEGVLVTSGTNFAIGSVEGSPTTPAIIEGLPINYAGSFGQQWWNFRMGAGGTDQINGADKVTLNLNGTATKTLTWNVANSRYQGSASEDLWGILSPQLGGVVTLQIAVGDVPIPDSLAPVSP